jgi:osmotically-inducible protein OsmY
MIRHRINRIPIVREGKVVGIVSRNDVLRALARTDEELAALVRETILRDLWIDADALDIQVRDGVVTIRGRVDRRGDISLIESYVRRIDGVVDVDVQGLTYALDERALAP